LGPGARSCGCGGVLVEVVGVKVCGSEWIVLMCGGVGWKRVTVWGWVFGER
jgi:hypothetical protein